MSRGDDRLSGKLGDIVLEEGDLLIMDAAEVGTPCHDYNICCFHTTPLGSFPHICHAFWSVHDFFQSFWN